MRRGSWHGVWLALGVLVWAQVGVEADQRGPGTNAGQSPGVPDDRPSDDPLAAPGGGGGGGWGGESGDLPSNVIPLLEGNPNGIDAVPTPETSPQGGGGGGPATDPSMINPFIRVLPGGDAADWLRSPSPSPQGRVDLF